LLLREMIASNQRFKLGRRAARPMTLHSRENNGLDRTSFRDSCTIVHHSMWKGKQQRNASLMMENEASLGLICAAHRVRGFIESMMRFPPPPLRWQRLRSPREALHSAGLCPVGDPRDHPAAAMDSLQLQESFLAIWDPWVRDAGAPF